MKFLVQKSHNQLPFDFSFHLVKCKEYYKWKNAFCKDNEFIIKYFNGLDPEIKNPDKYIPIGGIEFVSNYIKKYYPNSVEALKPLNVPEVLFPFAGRKIVNVNSVEDLNEFEGLAIYKKSLSTIKDETNGTDIINTEEDKKNLIGYQVSELMCIFSEWRVFVFHDMIVGLSNYSGDYMEYPNNKTIQQIVDTYKGNSPVAYTLDVVVTSTGTHILEVHRFFSCGLYGFNDMDILPYMFSQEWFEIKNLKRTN